MKRLKIIIGILLLLIIVSYVMLQVSKSRTFQFFGGIVRNVNTEEKLVALTFDDGPTHNTDKIIDILDELDVKATFFVTGKELEDNLEQGKKLVNAGHELGNHSYSHSRMILKSPSFIKDEIESTNKLIRQAGYKGEIHFRPPYFKKLIFLPYYLHKNDINTILCDVEPETILGFSASSEEISRYVIENSKEGSIILLHIMYDGRTEVLESLDDIVNGLRKKGYDFATISQLLDKK
ncbi:polysaccharide deacetylase family protein [Vallitalea guaymasensis]|uniref:polysaccharide deacetylase family protein n=1 Tax=Vallitalea guaymasensis TaxID=1185412 RepID=UPI00187D15D8|nr:polysaccharide deacetylase family protein [Vallitalea guaymasensis]